jgi:heme A synthase
MLLGPFILKIVVLILACVFAYQSYAAFRSARTEKDLPRRRHVVWGLVSLAISLGLFSI